MLFRSTKRERRRGLNMNISGTYTRIPASEAFRGAPPMPKITADPPDASCYLLFSRGRIQESQELGPDPWARDARGRFAKGSSGNPRGRPRGIPNPKRRVPDLAARPLSMQALVDLISRRPHLLRPLAAQLLPPPLRAKDPAALLEIYSSPLRSAEDCRRVLSIVLAAVARGEITPGDGVRIARQVHTRLCAVRRLAQSERRMPCKIMHKAG